MTALPLHITAISSSGNCCLSCSQSTETAVFRVVSYILEALDRGDLAALTLLDLSAVFNTVDKDLSPDRSSCSSTPLTLLEGSGLRPQIYGFCRPGDTQTLTDRTSMCIRDVATWMKSNRLQLNSFKTKVLWCAASRQQHSIPDASMGVCTDDVKPAKSVCDLGIYIDSDMSRTTRVTDCVQLFRSSKCLYTVPYVPCLAMHRA